MIGNSAISCYNRRCQRVQYNRASNSIVFDSRAFKRFHCFSFSAIPRFEFIVLRWESGNALSRFWNDRILLVRELLARDGGGIRNENERRCTVGGVVIFSGSGFARRSRRCRMGFRSGSKLRGTGVQRGCNGGEKWKCSSFFPRQGMMKMIFIYPSLCIFFSTRSQLVFSTGNWTEQTVIHF